MANIQVTDIDEAPVGMGDNEFEHDTPFNGADVLAKGTLLARDTSTLKWRLYVKGGSTNGNGVVGGVLTHAITTVAGDNSISVLISGPVNVDRCVIDADGDASNIDGTVRDLMRARGIIPRSVSQLSLDDNQQQVDS